MLIGMSLVGAVAWGQASPNLEQFVGKPAPEYKMTDVNGKVWTNKDFLGKVVLLDFWATWCGPCKQASPSIQKLHQNLGKKGLVVIGAETQDGGSALVAKSYAKSHGYTYLFTTKNDKLSTALGVPGLPSFVIIGKDGKVARVQTGIPKNIADLYPSFEKTIKGLLR
jgi:thiol-disulfide isomerase/thioredoxin